MQRTLCNCHSGFNPPFCFNCNPAISRIFFKFVVHPVTTFLARSLDLTKHMYNSQHYNFLLSLVEVLVYYLMYCTVLYCTATQNHITLHFCVAIAYCEKNINTVVLKYASTYHIMYCIQLVCKKA